MESLNDIKFESVGRIKGRKYIGINLSMNLTLFGFISYYNLVKNYESELIELRNNLFAEKIFNINQRLKLSKDMVIVPVRVNNSNINGKNLSGRYLYPSCLTRMILDGLIDDELVDELIKSIDNSKDGL